MSRWLRSLVLAVVPLVVLGLGSVTPAAASFDVIPMVDCVSYNAATGALTAEFGYYNPNPTTVMVPFGPGNIFLQAPNFRTGQPTTFQPGAYHDVFEETFTPSDESPQLTWVLQSSAAIASNDPNLYCGAPTLDAASLAMPATLTTTTGTDAQLAATVIDPKATATGTYGTVVYSLPSGLDAGTLPSGSPCVVATGRVACPVSAGSDDTVPVHSATPGLYPVTGTYASSRLPDSDLTDNVATTTVRVTGLPTAVTGIAGALTTTGAELTGNANPAGDAATGAFTYWPDGHPELAATVGSTALGGGFDTVALDAVLSGLTPGTTYDYKATATNGNGTADGAQHSFSTLAPPALSSALSLTASSAPATTTVGAPVTETFTVANAGPSDATGVQLTVTLPAGLTSVSAVPGAGSCSTSGTPATLTCTLGTVADGSNDVVTVTGTAAAAGTLLTSAFVAGDQPDPAVGDNAATTSVTVAPSIAPVADLSVAVTGPMSAHGPIHYTVVVRNAGPGAARNVQLALSPAYGRVTSVVSSGHYCRAGSAPGCVLGRISAGGVVRVAVTVAPAHLGPVTLTAQATTTSTDPDSGNNQASCTVRAR